MPLVVLAAEPVLGVVLSIVAALMRTFAVLTALAGTVPGESA